MDTWLASRSKLFLVLKVLQKKELRDTSRAKEKIPALHECFMIPIQNPTESHTVFSSQPQATIKINFSSTIKIKNHQCGNSSPSSGATAPIPSVVESSPSNQISFPMRARMCLRCQFQNWGSSLSPDSRLLEPVVLLSPA